MENAPQTGSVTSENPLLTQNESGRWSVSSAILSLTLMLIAGVGLGFLGDWIGLGHPKGMIFKILIAIPLSLVGLILLYRFGFSRSHVLILAGLGASAAILSMHYFEYRNFPRRLEPHLRDVIEGQILQQMVADFGEKTHQLNEGLAKLPPEKRKKWEQEHPPVGDKAFSDKLVAIARKLANPEKEKEMEPLFRRFDKELTIVRERIRTQGIEQMALGDRHQPVDPVVGPWFDNLGFWGYLNLRADQGVTIDLFGPKLHLNHTVSILYWIMEILLAGLVAGGLMYTLATDKELQKEFGGRTASEKPL